MPNTIELKLIGRTRRVWLIWVAVWVNRLPLRERWRFGIANWMLRRCWIEIRNASGTLIRREPLPYRLERRS